MALWGNSDNVGSAGTVSLDYSTGTVTGTDGVGALTAGTQFGLVGSAQTGDVIRFGIRGSGGTYFGDAVIVGIASTTQLTIGSTAGLSGAAIAGTDFSVSQLPKYTILDNTFSNTRDAAPTLTNQGVTGIAASFSPVGFSTVFIVPPTDLIVGDTVLNGGSDISVSVIGTNTITLGSTISAGIATGDVLTFKRYVGGYDSQVYGISTGAYNGYGSTTTSYRLDGEGWVGVTTYMDTHGNLRVKKEVLVAMSGITTFSIDYPTPV
jgi:hypothetical protein